MLVRFQPVAIGLTDRKEQPVSTLDATIDYAKQAAKRTGKEQFVFHCYGDEEAYFFGDEGSLRDHPRIVGTVSATEVHIWTLVH